MDKSKYVKIVLTVPEDYSDKVKEVMDEAGAGKIGNYSYCFFSTKGIGEFRPEAGTKPFIGKINKIESVEEERIETVCEREKLKKVIEMIKKVHPYEEIALDVYSLEDIGF